MTFQPLSLSRGDAYTPASTVTPLHRVTRTQRGRARGAVDQSLARLLRGSREHHGIPFRRSYLSSLRIHVRIYLYHISVYIRTYGCVYSTGCMVKNLMGTRGIRSNKF